MGEVAPLLSRFVDRPVVDRTGLTGPFDMVLTFVPEALRLATDPNSPTDATGQSMFTALEDQLGLKLQRAREPVEVLVIDHIERPDPD